MRRATLIASGASSDSTISIKEMAGLTQRLRLWGENQYLNLDLRKTINGAADMLEHLAVDREELDQQRNVRG